MKGIIGRRKTYVEVRTRTTAEGEITPLAIVWGWGVRYPIDEVLGCRPMQSLKTGASGICYTVRLGSAVTRLWYENPRWFVEEKVTDLPE